jgi:hypothetical protein
MENRFLLIRGIWRRRAKKKLRRIYEIKNAEKKGIIMKEKAVCPCGKPFIMKSIEIDNFHLCPLCRDIARRQERGCVPVKTLAVVVTVPEDAVEAIMQAHEDYLRAEQTEDDKFAAFDIAQEWLTSQIDTAGEITRAVLDYFEMPEDRDE